MLCKLGLSVKHELGIVLGQANSADPDQMPQNSASDQGLQCLLKLQEVKG